MKSWLKRIFGIFFVLLLMGGAAFYWHYHHSPHVVKFVPFQSKPHYLPDFLKEGIQLISDDYNSIKLWNTKTGNMIRTFETGQILFSEVSSDESKILAVSWDRRNIGIWDIETGKQILNSTQFSSSNEASSSYKEPIIAASFFDKGNKVFVLYRNYQVALWDIKTASIIKSSSVNFLKTQKPLEQCLEDWKLLLESTNSKGLLEQCALEESTVVFSPRPTEDGKSLVFANLETKDIEVWNLETQQKQCSFSNILGKTRKEYLFQFGMPFSIKLEHPLNGSHLLLKDQRHHKAFWLDLHSCQKDEIQLNTTFLDRSFLLPNQKILLGDDLLDSILWDPKTGTTQQPFQPSSLLSWVNQYSDKWFHHKFLIDPSLYHLYIDYKNQQVLVASHQGIYTFAMGQKWSLFQ